MSFCQVSYPAPLSQILDLPLLTHSLDSAKFLSPMKMSVSILRSWGREGRERKERNEKA